MGKMSGSLTKPERGTFNDFAFKIGRVFSDVDRLMRGGLYLCQPTPTGDIGADRLQAYYAARAERARGHFRLMALADLSSDFTAEELTGKEAFIDKHALKHQMLYAARLHLNEPKAASTDRELMSRIVACFYFAEQNREAVSRRFNKGLGVNKDGVNAGGIRNAVDRFMWDAQSEYGALMPDGGHNSMLLHAYVANIVFEARVLWLMWKRILKNKKDQFDTAVLDDAIVSGLIFEWRTEIEASIEPSVIPSATQAFMQQYIRRLKLRAGYLRTQENEKTAKLAS
jgi:hypothetical protein